MEINPETMPWESIYKIMIGSIVPRPIAWVSTLSETGQPNLAPFSFFNAVCANPPHVVFCPSIRKTDCQPKDTLRNLRQSGEFVVNVVTEALAEAMNLTSTELPEEINEFEYAGVEMAPSVAVHPPRVKLSPVNFECRVVHILDLGDEPGTGSVVVGRVVHLHVSDDVLLGEDKIDLLRLQPVGRLAGNSYCRVKDVFELIRPPSQIPRSQRS